MPRMHSFDPFPVLETPRLILRELVPADVDLIQRNASDPAVNKYLGRDLDTSFETAQKRLQTVLDNTRDHTGIRWGIQRKEDMVTMGTVGFWKWNKPHYYAEIGYEIGSAYWNKGYMTEAIRAALRFGFEQMELHRAEANIDPDNIGSRRAAEKAGFRHEATLRENWFYAGRFTDSVIYAVLKHEFEALERRGHG